MYLKLELGSAMSMDMGKISADIKNKSPSTFSPRLVNSQTKLTVNMKEGEENGEWVGHFYLLGLLNLLQVNIL